MKTFEENLNAWLEGRLTGEELAQFEASLPEISEAELTKQEDRQLTALLKEHISAPAMTNQEFFNHQLLSEIERDMPATAEHEFAEPRQSWWSISRLVWTGAASLAIFVVCTFFVVQQESPTSQSSYLTQITNARITDPAASPDATITMFESKEEKATVLWVEGLQSLPSEYAAK
jgi:hypothetical protein